MRVSSSRDSEYVCPVPPAQDLEQETVRLYHENAAGLFRYAIALVRNRESAQDAVQEAFLRFFVATSQGQKIEQPKPWLFQVLRNHILDMVKSSGARREVSLEDCGSPPEFRTEPESIKESLLPPALWAVLAPRELECLRLRAEGFRYEEIASILGVRCGTVGALLARAQEKIRKAVARPAGSNSAAHDASGPLTSYAP